MGDTQAQKSDKQWDILTWSANTEICLLQIQAWKVLTLIFITEVSEEDMSPQGDFKVKGVWGWRPRQHQHLRNRVRGAWAVDSTIQPCPKPPHWASILPTKNYLLQTNLSPSVFASD